MRRDRAEQEEQAAGLAEQFDLVPQAVGQGHQLAALDVVCGLNPQSRLGGDLGAEIWIVDFKTGRHEGADAEAFLDREMIRYREQLERYARIVREFDTRPIRLALYFPLVDTGWREWTFS